MSSVSSTEFLLESADAERTWRLDRLHHPNPIAPLDYWFFSEIVAKAIEAAWPVYGRPVSWSSRRINTYMYNCVQPIRPEPGGDERLSEASLRVRELWEDEILPEVLGHLEWWASFDLAAATTDDLIAHLDETIERARRVWFLHFLITAPSFQPVGDLADLYLEVCGGSDLDAFRLIQGFGNKTVDAGRELWRLAAAAAAQPEVAAAVNGSDPMPALEQTAEGRAWLAEFRSFLGAYGMRSDAFGLGNPSWIERPSAPLDALRRLMTVDDPYADLERLAAEREAAIADARRRFADAPDEKRKRFEELLAAAQAGIVITEDHGFYIDFATNYRIRQVFVEVGRRLADAGLMDDADDVAMLGVDEIRETVNRKADRRALVRSRRAEMERFDAVHPPEFVGAPPQGPPPDDPRSRFARRFYGPPGAGLVDGHIRGSSGAPGKAVGVARVVLDLGAASKLEPGDVLVTRTTSPAWTPLFAFAGAVVTDGGGILSHCAIVAREYGIPAVVGTMNGTISIADGQRVEVDGDAGIVRIVG